MCLTKEDVKRITQDLVNSYRSYDDIGEWLSDSVLDINYILDRDFNLSEVVLQLSTGGPEIQLWLNNATGARLVLLEAGCNPAEVHLGNLFNDLWDYIYTIVTDKLNL